MSSNNTDINDSLFSERIHDLNNAQINSTNSANILLGKNLYNYDKDLLQIDTIAHIIGIPPIPNNVVDPPPIYSQEQFGEILRPWVNPRIDGGPLVGMDYFDRVLARGQFLILLPYEMRVSLLSLAASSSDSKLVQTFGKLVGAIAGVLNSDGDATPGSFGDVMSMAAYGFRFKTATDRYRKAVLAHANAAAYSLGINLYNQSEREMLASVLPPLVSSELLGQSHSSGASTSYDGRTDRAGNMMNRAERVVNGLVGGANQIGQIATTIAASRFNGGLGNVSSGGAPNSSAGNIASSYLGSSSIGGGAGAALSSIGSVVGGVASAIGGALMSLTALDSAVTTLQSDLITNLATLSNSGMSFGTPVGGGGITAGINVVNGRIDPTGMTNADYTSAATTMNNLNTFPIPNLPVQVVRDIAQMAYNFADGYYRNTASAQTLLRYVAGYDPEAEILPNNGEDQGDGGGSLIPATTLIKGLNWIVINCNGPIERSVRFSNAGGESEIAKAISQAMNPHKFISDGVAGLVAGIKNTVVRTALGAASNVLNQSEGVLHEANIHSSSNALNTLTNSVAIPEVITGSSVEFSYNVKVRVACMDTTKYSRFRIFYAFAQLAPLIIPVVHKGSRFTVIPKVPMYCSAFCKGIMNLPRAYISSLNIECDPKFQTTSGSPTQIDISFMVTPILKLMTMPDFGSWFINGGIDFGKEGDPDRIDENFYMSQLFNPTGSMNWIATLAGINTVMMKPDLGFWELLGNAILAKSVDGVLTIWKNFKRGSFGARFNDWVTSESFLTIGLRGAMS